MAKKSKVKRGHSSAVDEAKEPTLADLPRDLRGPSNNKFGGQNSLRMRGFKGLGDYPTLPGRVLEGEEKLRVLEDLRKRKLID